MPKDALSFRPRGRLGRCLLPQARLEEPPLRRELFSISLLERHARTLAQRHQISIRKGPDHLLPRLRANAHLLRAYNEETLLAEKSRRITPAAEWLADNFHLIDEQIRTARRHLPRGFSRELPHLIEGPAADLPRVYDLAQELISHIDGRIDAPHLSGFITAYQEISPLKLGELWAIPIMLRLALIENLRRMAAILRAEREDRDLADEWMDQMSEAVESDPAKLIVVVGRMAQSRPTLSRAFVTQFWRRTQEKTSTIKLAVGWIEERLAEKGVTVEQLVQSESQHQAANQVSVGNSICSLRFLDAMDWRDFVEAQSFVEQLLRADPVDVYRQMDFTTRDQYRHAVERIARRSTKSESEVASLAIGLARARGDDAENRQAHVGFYLVDKGVNTLERTARMKPTPGELVNQLARHYRLTAYTGGILIVALGTTLPLLQWIADHSPTTWLLVVMASLILLCASQLGVSLVNWFATVFVAPRHLPRLDFTKGIPPAHATLVVVPAMLASARGIENLLEALDVRYLANRDDQVYFALLTDFRDAPIEHLPEDEPLLRQVSAGIQTLNEKYKSDRPTIFFLFHRPRLWNKAERAWMGYERKRGKLADLNRLLRGGSPECFSHIVGDVSKLPRIQYVITLDTDTQLPRDAARQLAGAMAHPLNRPVYDSERGLMVEGYSILQPRVAVSLPSARRSLFVKLFSGEPGFDPYTRAVSDVYQDVFEEGSFIGKGIYDVDAFERAVGGKFPENRILSHDLLEGCHARSALISDVQLFEDFPARYNTDTQRRHRWIRGDWQIATWLLPRVPGTDVRSVKNPLSGLSFWKIFDNLRRSLVPPALILLLALGWAFFPERADIWSLFIMAIIGFPSLLSVLTDLLRKPTELPLLLHLKNTARSAGQQLAQTLLTLTFLPYDACISLDAVARTLGRLIFTHRNLLEWQTANDAERNTSGSLKSFCVTMRCAPEMALALGLASFAIGTQSWLAVLPFLLVWFLSPVAAWWISLPLKEKPAQLSAGQRWFLRTMARKTWRYFETFAGPEDHWLPPDNFQENPHPVLATRTSPTNIGLGLLGALAAHDFGYLSLNRLTHRLTDSLVTLEKMDRHLGHFYNWYDTRTLKPMPPLYLSTVDNGNLGGLLLTLHSGLLELGHVPWSSDKPLAGLRDTLLLWIEHAETGGDAATLGKLAALKNQLLPPAESLAESFHRLGELLAAAGEIHFAPDAKPDDEFGWWKNAFEQTCREHQADLKTFFPWLELQERVSRLLTADHALPDSFQELWHQVSLPQSLQQFASKAEARIAKVDEWLNNAASPPLSNEARELLADFRTLLEAGGKAAAAQLDRLETLATQFDELARMDFTLLYDESRELFSIGYNVTQHRLETNYYDLLASEARLGSYVGIALGQLPQKHWFTLGRLLTTTNGAPTLISWSGSMFEYLMPMLVMPTFQNTLLDLTCKSAVARQIEYGGQMNVPWGISESGYNLRDQSANYQYRAFGVPGLGFKRGLAEELVIAPYASVMALMISPEEACRNLEALRQRGAEGKFGFYEALDYTASRVPRGQDHVLIESFMAHHQGMSLLSLAHLLLDQPMQRRFNDSPLFKSAELLLHERVPKGTSVLYPHELEATTSRESVAADEMTFRLFTDPNAGPPEVHLLSNGRYHVMITNSGGGYSQWNDTALTRWREDPTRDCWGTFIYFRDTKNDRVWSAAYQPTLVETRIYEAIFSQGRAEFRSRLDEIENHTEISVSPEDDVEVRRVTLTNHSDKTRALEVTTYAEIVLNTFAADNAHPAFSNLFVQTHLLRPHHAIICSRRARAPGEQPPWMFHLLLVQGEETGQASYETDRARFIGRNHSPAAPAALRETTPLSNTEGSVLDPIAAIRRTVAIPSRASARFTLVSGIAATREALLKMVEKYQDHTLADRCFELAWTHGLVVLRNLNATEAEAQLFGRLAGALLFHQPLRGANPTVLARNRRGQRNLWSFGISGDLPIVLLRHRHPERTELIREIVQAHAYWRLKGLMADLMILSEDSSVYRQPLQDQILTFIASGNPAQVFDRPGGIFIRRVDQLSAEDLILLESAARVVLSDDRDSLAQQLQRRNRSDLMPQPLNIRKRTYVEAPAEPTKRDLLFFNGLGGFTRDGREYVITLPANVTTPAPWVNVLANPHFGTVVSESGSAYTWAENCHEFRLTPWHNDAVTDAGGEAYYIRDEQSGRFWSPTPLPARGQTPYVTRHGFGYSIFAHVENGIASELSLYVAADAPVKFALVKLRNVSNRKRELTLTGYWEWVLGELRHKNAPHIATEYDLQTGALFARNYYNTDFHDHVAFVSCTQPAASVTCDRTEFIGRNRTLVNPAALSRTRLSGKRGLGLDPCAALQVPVELPPGQEQEIVFMLGAAKDLETARGLLQQYRGLESCRQALEGVWDYWDATLGAVQVETPDPALNVLANGWLLYQTISCRLWARTGFYQSGGAFGFRDQLQDAMALVHSRPVLLREQLLRAAAHQFREGDVQHWWHPPHDRGVRTHFSDDYLWLPYATCRYVETINDTGVLDSVVPFLEARTLRPDEESNYDSPQQSTEAASLYAHCVRAIRHGLKFGAHGLPLMGCGDWNDGMNLVGAHGKGESVWLAFFLYDVLKHFRPLAQQRGDEAFAKFCEDQAVTLQENIEKNGWDGAWYRRAFFDNGEPLGSASNPECQIDSLPQSWAILSGAGDPVRSNAALTAVTHRLVRREARLIQLFDPPFDKSNLEPGYIKGYAPGVRENGGQYTHAAIWAVMAFALVGETARAWELFGLINPVTHGSTPEEIARYKVEPYVVAADVYGVPPHTGRGGWTWYTGSAGWMYRLLIETFIGLSRAGDQLHFSPRLPAEWRSLKICYRYRGTSYYLSLTNASGNWQNPPKILVDAKEQSGASLTLIDDRVDHHVIVLC